MFAIDNIYNGALKASNILVVGDIIMVEAGDFIPADARIIECSNLRVDESALTGESVTVEKTSEKGIPFASVRWNYGRRTDYHCGRS